MVPRPVIAALLFSRCTPHHMKRFTGSRRASICWRRSSPCWRSGGLSGRSNGFAHRRMGGAFGMALLSKESAISLLVVAPAWDVWIERRDWRTTARRLLPLLLVAAAYLAIRSLGTDVAVTGGAETPRQGGSARAGARGGACGGVATRQRGYSP
jgi:hypothetical protein